MLLYYSIVMHFNACANLSFFILFFIPRSGWTTFHRYQNGSWYPTHSPSQSK